MSSNTNFDTDLGLEENTLLVPIGGQAICEDAAPTKSKLGQMEVDHEIVRMMALEEHMNLEKSQSSSLIGVPNQNQNALIGKQPTSEQPDRVRDSSSALKGVPSNSSEVQESTDPTPTALIGVPPKPPEVQLSTDSTSTSANVNTTPTVEPSGGNKGVCPKTSSGQQPTNTTGKKGSKGAFKSQLYGLHHNHLKDRAYKCQVCGKSKCSMESLNEHHRRNHNPQMCGVCGKLFDLATTLAHHMYSHYTRKHYCDKCHFHCFLRVSWKPTRLCIENVLPINACT